MQSQQLAELMTQLYKNVPTVPTGCLINMSELKLIKFSLEHKVIISIFGVADNGFAKSH